ncbi:MAG: hypothetical protein V3W04_10280 [Gammaproteobacteria bacterium]
MKVVNEIHSTVPDGYHVADFTDHIANKYVLLHSIEAKTPCVVDTFPEQGKIFCKPPKSGIKIIHIHIGDTLSPTLKQCSISGNAG